MLICHFNPQLHCFFKYFPNLNQISNYWSKSVFVQRAIKQHISRLKRLHNVFLNFSRGYMSHFREPHLNALNIKEWWHSSKWGTLSPILFLLYCYISNLILRYHCFQVNLEISLCNSSQIPPGGDRSNIPITEIDSGEDILFNKWNSSCHWHC